MKFIIPKLSIVKLNKKESREFAITKLHPENIRTHKTSKSFFSNSEYLKVKAAPIVKIESERMEIYKLSYLKFSLGVIIGSIDPHESIF